MTSGIVLQDRSDAGFKELTTPPSLAGAPAVELGNANETFDSVSVAVGSSRFAVILTEATSVRLPIQRIYRQIVKIQIQ